LARVGREQDRKTRNRSRRDGSSLAMLRKLHGMMRNAVITSDEHNHE
jgi:hypothetical protein